MTFFQQLQRVETAHLAVAAEPDIPTNLQCMRAIHKFAERTLGDIGTDPTILYINLILQLVTAMREHLKGASKPRLMHQDPAPLAQRDYVVEGPRQEHSLPRRERDVQQVHQHLQQLAQQPVGREVNHPRREREVAFQQPPFTSLQPLQTLAHSSLRFMTPSPSTPQHVWSGVSRPTYGQPEATPVLAPSPGSDTSLVSSELNNILNTFNK